MNGEGLLVDHLRADRPRTGCAAGGQELRQAAKSRVGFPIQRVRGPHGSTRPTPWSPELSGIAGCVSQQGT